MLNQGLLEMLGGGEDHGYRRSEFRPLGGKGLHVLPGFRG